MTVKGGPSYRHTRSVLPWFVRPEIAYELKPTATVQRSPPARGSVPLTNRVCLPNSPLGLSRPHMRAQRRRCCRGPSAPLTPWPFFLATRDLADRPPNALRVDRRRVRWRTELRNSPRIRIVVRETRDSETHPRRISNWNKSKRSWDYSCCWCFPTLCCQ